MSQRFDPKRRAISTGAALALLGFPLISIGGCGGGGSTPVGPSASTPSPSPTPSPTSGAGVAGVVSENHPAPHLAVITAAQLSAGLGLTLNISNGLHPHTVVLTAAQVTQTAARARVSVESSTDPHSDGTGRHSHLVTFN